MAGGLEGVDYSGSRPDLRCLEAEGKTFVVRYVSVGPHSKNMTKAEVDALIAAGISVVTVYEESAGEMLDGFESGRTAARRARRMAADAGMPDNRPIYFALDIDPNPLSGAEIAACRRFLDGAANEIGRDNVGVYAGFRGIELLCPDSAPWGWQTFAWSKNHDTGQIRWSAKAQLQQYRNGQKLCADIAHPGKKAVVDFDRSTADDFGQWPFDGALKTATTGMVRDMAFMVRKSSSGAVLLVTGNSSLLVTSNAMLANHTGAGIPLVECDDNQFSRYEGMRVDN